MKPTNHYLSGFNNHHQTEALAGALPLHQNSPQKVPFNLYAEQLSGSAFTRARHQNLHSWLYRMQPSVVQSEFAPYSPPSFYSSELVIPQPPLQLRWSPFNRPATRIDFIDGLTHVATSGSSPHPTAALYIYQITKPMQQRYFYDADGELVFVLQDGELQFNTEMGCLTAAPGEIVVIPRGVKFQVINNSDYCSGYLCENFQTPFTLPELGLIGANGLANPRDFYYPVAQYQQLTGDFTLIIKYQEYLWQAAIDHSPLDVVAWHGNYAPYKYDLRHFNAVNSVNFDHSDPSIFTVLTSSSNTPGVANIDFVIFPERWVVSEHTFRPPYFHRNIMSEFMGLIYGSYDAKQEGFAPGGFSIHNGMLAHGPDSDAYDKAIKQTLIPERYENTLAFMFESHNVWQVTQYAYDHPARQSNYQDCWQGLKQHFKI